MVTTGVLPQSPSRPSVLSSGSRRRVVDLYWLLIQDLIVVTGTERS